MNSSEFKQLIYKLEIEIGRNNRSIESQLFIKSGLEKLALYKHKEFIYEQIVTLIRIVQASIQAALLLLTLVALLIAALLAIHLALEVLFTLPFFRPLFVRRGHRE